MAVLALGERRQGLQPVKRTSRIVVNRRASRGRLAMRSGRGRGTAVGGCGLLRVWTAEASGKRAYDGKLTEAALKQEDEKLTA